VKVTIELPKVGRKRLIATGALAATGAALWIWSATRLAAPDTVWLHVLVGIGIPLGIGWVTLLLMERRIVRDLRTVARPVRPEPQLRAGADLEGLHS
jgi:hypothetical protein